VGVRLSDGIFAVQGSRQGLVCDMRHTSQRIRLLSGAVALAALALAASALAGPDRLDPSWNGNGKVVFPGDKFTFGAETTDARGRVLVAGVDRGEHLMVMRFEKDGKLDPSFGSDGAFTSSTDASRVWAVATDSKGRIVVVSYEYRRGYTGVERVWRLTPSGQPDTSFHSVGYKGFKWPACCQTTPSDFPLRLAIDGHDRPVVAGTDYPAHGEGVEYAVARLTANGNLDRSFDRDGFVIGDLGSLESVGLALDSHGRIVLAGTFLSKPRGARGARFYITKLNSDGSVDTGFADHGLRLGAFGSFKKAPDSYGVDMALDHGRIVVAGIKVAPHQRRCCRDEFALARYKANGAIDRRFGSGGHVVIPLNHKGKRANAVPEALAVDSKGRYLLSGFSGIEHFGFASGVALVRIIHGGKPDPSFGSKGRVKVKALHGGKNEHDEGLDVVADARNRPVVVGNATPAAHRAEAKKTQGAFALRFKP
jgi:uncharacterized delta-60 repeat protein